MAKSRLRRQIALTLAFVVFGMLLTVQFRTQQDLRNSLAYRTPDEQVVIWKKLLENRNKLEGEVNELNKELTLLAEQDMEGKNTMKDLRQSLDRLKTASGFEAAKGPGIRVFIDRSAPLLYLDLIDLVNELWASDAEAIAVGNYRITANTAFADTEEYNTMVITVDGEKLQYPITIEAIGDPSTLEKGLTFTGGIIDNLNTAGISTVIEKADQLVLPGAKVPSWKYARSKSSS